MGPETSSTGDFTVGQRLRQNKVLPWGCAYLGVALAITYWAKLLGHTFGWPENIQRLIALILMLGFPVALTLAWYRGRKGLPGIAAGELLIASILLFIPPGLLVLFARVPARHEVSLARSDGTRAPAVPKTAGATGISLAVLPFIDLSPAHNQEYFSDGLTEELINQLARIRDLRLTARTSSFAFKGKNEDLRVIGEKLGVAYLLEGSVRKDGPLVRITAQLITSRDGTNIWSDAFDRRLKDIFAIQEQIGTEVANALSVTLDVGDMARSRGGTTNLDAYDKFLRALKLSGAVGYETMPQAIELYREAVMLDPDFSRAWAALYLTLQYSIVYFPERTAEIRKEQDAIASQAERLAQNTSSVQLIRGLNRLQHHAWGEAATAFEAALPLASPSDTDFRYAYSNYLAYIGRVHEAILHAERVRTQDPLNLRASTLLQNEYGIGGRADQADAEYERSKPLTGVHQANDYHALMRLLRKNAEPRLIEAQFRQYHAQDFNAFPLTRYLMQHWQDRADSIAAVRRAYADPANQDILRLFVMSEFADYYGDKDIALAVLRRQYVDNSQPGVYFIWSPFVTSLRADPRFKQMLRDLKLVDYYRATGNWGDFCHPVGADDFECR